MTFAGFPTLTSRALTIKLKVFVPNANYNITWPAAVVQGLGNIANTTGQVTSFTDTGFYEFELTTLNSGATWQIKEPTRNLSIVQGNLTLTALIANITTSGISMTVANIGGTAVGNITASNFFGPFTSTGNNISVTGNITANNITANTAIYGNIATPTQSGITLVGTLTSLSVSGNANVGNLTVSGMSDACGGDMYGVQFANATNSGSTQIWSNIGFTLVNPTSSTIASHTIIMPATAQSGQIIRIGFSNTVTTLTQNGYGTDTVNGALTTANANVGSTWIYYVTPYVNSGNGVWYRIG